MAVSQEEASLLGPDHHDRTQENGSFGKTTAALLAELNEAQRKIEERDAEISALTISLSTTRKMEATTSRLIRRMQHDLEDRERRIKELEGGQQQASQASRRSSKVISEGLESTGVAAAARGALGSHQSTQRLAQAESVDEVALHTLLALRAAAKADEAGGDDEAGRQPEGGQGRLAALLEDRIARLQAKMEGSPTAERRAADGQGCQAQFQHLGLGQLADEGVVDEQLLLAVAPGDESNVGAPTDADVTMFVEEADPTGRVSLVSAARAAGVSAANRRAGVASPDLDVTASPDGIALRNVPGDQASAGSSLQGNLEIQVTDGGSFNFFTQSNGSHSPGPPSPGKTWKAAEALVADVVQKRVKPPPAQQAVSKGTSRRTGGGAGSTGGGRISSAMSDTSAGATGGLGGGYGSTSEHSTGSVPLSTPHTASRGRQVTPVSMPMRVSRSPSPSSPVTNYAQVPTNAPQFQWQGSHSFQYGQNTSPQRSPSATAIQSMQTPSTSLRVVLHETISTIVGRNSACGGGSGSAAAAGVHVGGIGGGAGSLGSGGGGLREQSRRSPYGSVASMPCMSTVTSQPTGAAGAAAVAQATMPLSAMAASTISASSNPMGQQSPTPMNTSRAPTPGASTTVPAHAPLAAAPMPFAAPPPVAPVQPSSPRLTCRSTSMAAVQASTPRLASRATSMTTVSPQPASPRMVPTRAMQSAKAPFWRHRSSSPPQHSPRPA